MRERAGDWQELEQLNARYAHALDHNELAAFLALFTQDALYTLGPRRSRGHGELAAFFAQRQADGPRTTRHLYSGLQLCFQDAVSATGQSVWMSFAGQGVAPLSPAQPYLVADMQDRYVLQDGRWCVAERHIQPIFRQPVP